MQQNIEHFTCNHKVAGLRPVRSLFWHTYTNRYFHEQGTLNYIAWVLVSSRSRLKLFKQAKALCQSEAKVNRNLLNYIVTFNQLSCSCSACHVPTDICVNNNNLHIWRYVDYYLALVKWDTSGPYLKKCSSLIKSKYCRRQTFACFAFLDNTFILGVGWVYTYYLLLRKSYLKRLYIETFKNRTNISKKEWSSSVICISVMSTLKLRTAERTFSLK